MWRHLAGASAVLLLLSGSRGEAAAASTPAGQNVAAGVLQVGRIAHPQIAESSGIVASRKHAGVFWTHNDGGIGREPVLYAITREGKSVGQCVVTGAALVDWEDLAADSGGRLFIGDIGNNGARRTELAVYEIDEPDPRGTTSVARVKRGWRLRFPEAPFDCEALFVWQSEGYVVSKVFNDQQARLYRFPLADRAEPCTLDAVATLRVESPVTGADLTADGALLGLVAKAGAYLFPIHGDPRKAGALKPHRTRFTSAQVEGCCFVPEGLLATAESREILLFTEEPFRPPGGGTPKQWSASRKRP
jgi:hypothetical protein